MASFFVPITLFRNWKILERWCLAHVISALFSPTLGTEMKVTVRVTPWASTRLLRPCGCRHRLPGFRSVAELPLLAPLSGNRSWSS